MLHIPESEIDKQAKQIFSLVKNNENGIGLCYPTCKISYNLLRFLSSKQLLKKYLGLLYRRVFFLPIQLSFDDTEVSFLQKVRSQLISYGIHAKENDLLDDMCERVLQSGKEPYFFLLNTQDVADKNLESLLKLLHEQSIKSHRVRCLIFFEKNIYEPPLSMLLSRYSNFLQNILTFKPISIDDTKYFLETLAKEYKITLKKETISELIASFGGYLWILKSAVRFVRDNQNDNIDAIHNAPSVQIKLSAFYSTLSEKEQKDLANLCFENYQNISERNKDYFIQIGLVEEKNKKFLCTLPALTPFLKKTLAANNLTVINNETIFYNGKDVGQHLTAYEKRALSALLQERNKLLSRDVFAQKIWGDEWEEKYSDWALDKLISRLRKSLQQIGLPSTIITTRKRQGFLIS